MNRLDGQETIIVPRWMEELVCGSHGLKRTNEKNIFQLHI